MEKLDLGAKSLIELKAIAYDLNAAIQQYRDLLGAVNQEISNKIVSAENVKAEVKVEDKKSTKKGDKVEKAPEQV